MWGLFIDKGDEGHSPPWSSANGEPGVCDYGQSCDSSKVPAKIIRPPRMRWRRTHTKIPSLQRKKIKQVTWLQKRARFVPSFSPMSDFTVTEGGKPHGPLRIIPLGTVGIVVARAHSNVYNEICIQMPYVSWGRWGQRHSIFIHVCHSFCSVAIFLFGLFCFERPSHPMIPRHFLSSVDPASNGLFRR